jgi:hypothetical protein
MDEELGCLRYCGIGSVIHCSGTDVPLLGPLQGRESKLNFVATR